MRKFQMLLPAQANDLCCIIDEAFINNTERFEVCISQEHLNVILDLFKKKIPKKIINQQIYKIICSEVQK